MGDYLELYLNSALATGTFESFLSLLLLTLARLFPIIAMSPFFGARVLPHPVKVMLGITLFVVFLPVLLTELSAPLYFNTRLLFYFFKEVFIGFSLGFLMSIPFSIAQNVGMIIDHQRGGASLMVNDPTIQNQSSPLGTLFNMVLIYIFFIINGPFYFMNAIVLSYQVLPPDQLLSSTFFVAESPFWENQLLLLNRVMVISAQLGAPALIAILMTDMFLGITNRLAPQVQITFLGLPLKSLLALTVVCLGWKNYNQQMVTEVFKWITLIKESIHAFDIGL